MRSWVALPPKKLPRRRAQFLARCLAIASSEDANEGMHPTAQKPGGG